MGDEFLNVFSDRFIIERRTDCRKKDTDLAFAMAASPQLQPGSSAFRLSLSFRIIHHFALLFATPFDCNFISSLFSHRVAYELTITKQR